MAELVALMDLGSNAARFLLASLHPGAGFRILEEQRVQTRLGSSPSGLLPSAAWRRPRRPSADFSVG